MGWLPAHVPTSKVAGAHTFFYLSWSSSVVETGHLCEWVVCIAAGAFPLSGGDAFVQPLNFRSWCGVLLLASLLCSWVCMYNAHVWCAVSYTREFT